MQTQSISTPVVANGSAVDPVFAVILPSGASGEWAITQNLTSRWGEINDHESLVAAVQPLIDDCAMLENLGSQMWDELTFIVRKDGQYGILFENEYCTKESEAYLAKRHEAHDSDFLKELKDEAVLLPILVKAMAGLSAKYPTVQFCIPPKKEIVEERLAIWAFVNDNQLPLDQLEALGRDLLNA